MYIILWWNCSVPHFYQCTVSHKQIRFIVSFATLKVWNRAQVIRESRFLLYIKKMFNSKGSGMDNYFLRKKEGSWKLAVGSSLPIFPPTHTPTQKKNNGLSVITFFSLLAIFPLSMQHSIILLKNGCVCLLILSFGVLCGQCLCCHSKW